MLDRFAQPSQARQQFLTPPDQRPSPIEHRASYCNRSVWFTATDADQLLLQTIDDLLEAGDYSSFSDLCKQALRAWLLPDEPQTDPSLMMLQQQMMALQLQVNQLSQQLAQTAQTAPSVPSGSAELRPALITTLEAQVSALLERVAHLEARTVQTESPKSAQEFVLPNRAIPPLSVDSISVTSIREADPLLDRLVALVEDF
ncbi:ribbon-helix-helix domain-containing protein [Leptolyngbya ohadii]|uniref:ribbon-helix-helix domain-containing protein n=1 Tax=Leptolyngbya ohadii TaxID=1962290 RepID=UPI000B598AD6|nr:ribbon-helix-helix domain-containing protein [Leptolyngbya ohadii]